MNISQLPTTSISNNYPSNENVNKITHQPAESSIDICSNLSANDAKKTYCEHVDALSVINNKLKSMSEKKSKGMEVEREVIPKNIVDLMYKSQTFVKGYPTVIDFIKEKGISGNDGFKYLDIDGFKLIKNALSDRCEEFRAWEAVT